MKNSKRYDLIAERKRNGLTQQELGDLLGVSVATIANWEDRTSAPNAALIIPLADALKVRVEDVVRMFA